jgi:hypothetical protein
VAHDVFISYSSHDKTIADAVCATLERHGLRCWIAPRDIRIGQNWGAEVIRAISASRAMVLILSANANISPQIHREVERAVNRGVTILPLRVEDVVPSEELEYFIGSVHWLDAITRPIETHLESLARKIRALLSEQVAADPTPEPVRQAPPTEPSSLDPRPSEPSITAPPPQALPEPTGDDESQTIDGDGPERPAGRPMREVVLAFSVIVVLILAAGLFLYWRAAEFRFDSEAASLEGHEQGVLSLAFNRDARRLASASRDRTVKIWDPANGTAVATLQGHASTVRSVQFSRNSAVLASGGDDHTIRLWNAETGQLLQTVSGHQDSVSSVAFSPVRNLLASGSPDNTVRLWEPGRSSGSATSAYFAGDSVGEWKTPLAEVRKIDAGDVMSLAFSPDGRLLASGEQWGQISIWEVGTGRKVHSMEVSGPTSPTVFEVAFSPGGRYLASASSERIDLWDVSSGDSVRRYYDEVGDASAYTVTFSADGRFLATGNYGGVVKLWRLESSASIQSLVGPYDCPLNSVKFSPDTQWLVAGASCQQQGASFYLRRWKRR